MFGLGGACVRGAARRMLGVLATGSLARTSPSRVGRHAQCDDFPTSSPMTISGLFGGAMVVSSNRQIDRKPSRDTHITWPWRPRPAVSYQSFGAASASGGNTPPALFGAGADGHPEAPDRRPLGACPYRRQCAECSPPKFIGGLPQTVMGERKAAFSILVVSTKQGVLVVFRMVDDCWLLKDSRCSFCVAFVR